MVSILVSTPRNALFCARSSSGSSTIDEASALGTLRRSALDSRWVFAYLTHYFWRMGDHARAIESDQREAHAIAEELGDFEL